jgi:hypothetical protein
MALSYYEYGMPVKHFRNKRKGSIPFMAKTPPAKELLWTNLTALMLHHWKEINLNRLAREAKIGPASAMRIKESKTSVGVDIVDSVAGVFGLRAWQLLLPDLDPQNVPVTMLSDAERRLYDRFKRVNAILTEGHQDAPAGR